MKTAVVMMNIGTPDAASVESVTTYLEKFLMDPYVVDIPKPLRWFLVKKLIVPKRAPESAKNYESVWMKEGSPLKVLTQRLIDTWSGEHPDYDFYMGMRYSSPSIEASLDRIFELNYKKIILLPMYPHYAESSTRSSLEVAEKYIEKKTRQLKITKLEVQTVQSYYDHPSYIQNIVEEAKSHLSRLDFKPDFYLFSYHGLPERHLKKMYSTCLTPNCCDSFKADRPLCYKAHCAQTTKLVAEKLGLSSDQFQVSFQSRLGRSKWIEPYTDVELQALPKKNIKNLVVFTLAFTIDCLETLEEIDKEGEDIFLKAGGQNFSRVPCLNENFNFDFVKN